MAAEKEITMHQHTVGAHRDRVNDLTRENGELALRNQSNIKHIAEVSHLPLHLSPTIRRIDAVIYPTLAEQSTV